MNKELLSILAVLALLAGCAGIPHASSSIGTVNISGCTVLPVGVCDGKGNDPNVKLDLDNWTVTPECITAKKGTKITVQIKSARPVEEHSVWIFPKDFDNLFWLARSNSPSKNKIEIKVKGKKPNGRDLPEGIYRYGIWTDGKCIDPRVRVKT